MKTVKLSCVGYTAACLSVLIVLPAVGVVFLFSQPRSSESNLFVSSSVQRLGVIQARRAEKAGRPGVVVWQGMRTVFYPIEVPEAPGVTRRLSVLLPNCSPAEIVLRSIPSEGDSWLGLFEPASPPKEGRMLASAAEPGIALNRSGHPVFAQTAEDGGLTCR